MAGLVITGGRVVDPASGMDAIGDVAVLDGRIAAVGTGLGSAERAIDATGLVVAPASSTCTRMASQSRPTACRPSTG
jgi:N-acyl-D-glutamate deacylase